MIAWYVQTFARIDQVSWHTVMMVKNRAESVADKNWCCARFPYPFYMFLHVSTVGTKDLKVERSGLW